MSKVELGLPSRGMLLGEIDLSVRPILRTPPERFEGPVIVAAGWATGRRSTGRGDAPHPELAEGHSIIVVALSLPPGSPRSNGSISSSHMPSKGSGRVRQWGYRLVSDGIGPLCHFRADRTLMPATAAVVSCVFPSIRLCLNATTCRSVINPAPPYLMCNPSRPAKIVAQTGRTSGSTPLN